MQNLNILAQQIHENAKAKGFWDQPRNTGEVFMLIVSELSEALEADRKGRRASLEGYELYKRDAGFDVDVFKAQIKDTFEDEIADVVIRILDWCFVERLNIEIDLYEEHGDFELDNDVNIGQVLLEMTSWVCKAYNDNFTPQEACLNAVLILAKNLSIHLHFDLQRHIELKMQYNATSERMHGKKY